MLDFLVTVLERDVAEDERDDDEEFRSTVVFLSVERLEETLLSDERVFRFTVLDVALAGARCVRSRVTALRDVDVRVLVTALRSDDVVADRVVGRTAEDRVAVARSSLVRVLLIVCREAPVLVRAEREVTTVGPDAVITRRGALGLFCTIPRLPTERRASV